MNRSISILFNQSIVASSSFNYRTSRFFHRTPINMTKALVLGAYQQQQAENPSSGTTAIHFTELAQKFDAQLNGKLSKLVQQFGPTKKGKAKVYYGLTDQYPVVSVVGLGSPDAGFNEAEDLDEKRENIRVAMGSAARTVREEKDVDEIHFDHCGDAEAASEGANLALHKFDELKSEKYKKKVVKVDVYNPNNDPSVKQQFDKGTKLAVAQNVCRRFAEMPSNHMTPTIFAQTTVELFKDLPNVKVIIHDQKWAEDKKMGAFLGVAKGSAEPPKFVEIHYNNKPDSKPFALVGKGICFDSGGISIKPANNMDKMRYDMSGAANVVSTTYALATLNAPVNVITLAPMCENLPSGTAVKPGDVLFAMNGKSIQVDNTDAEGRLVLADALCYAHEFQPQAVLDIATLTGAMKIALGSATTGVFTNSTKMYDIIREASYHTGDRVWRMPVYNLHKTHVTDSQLADCLNVGKVAGLAGACTAAAFLSEFVTCKQWVHLDIAGVMESKDELSYYPIGMSGRPLRTLYYFVNNFFKNN